MVATGTGIAPYRSFLRRLFVEKTPYGEAYKGLAWLFLGVANSDALLYDDEWQEVLKSHPENFRLDYALSREQTNVDGGKMYIQDKVKEYADEVFDRMDKGVRAAPCVDLVSETSDDFWGSFRLRAMHALHLCVRRRTCTSAASRA